MTTHEQALEKATHAYLTSDSSTSFKARVGLAIAAYLKAAGTPAWGITDKNASGPPVVDIYWVKEEAECSLGLDETIAPILILEAPHE